MVLVTEKTRLGGLAFLAVIGTLVWFALIFDPEPRPDTILDDDLCQPGGDIAAGITFLVDLSKPLDPAHRELPGALLHDAGFEAEIGTELRVYAVGRTSAAPREFLGRVCKPYGNADLQVDQAKDQRDGARDCDDIPAQTPLAVRDAAERFCARRDALVARIDALAGSADRDSVPHAYLIEALEDTALEFEERALPAARLYVFSDMMQHAAWYSHLDLGWQWWRFEDFATMRGQRLEAVGPRPVVADIDVTLYLVERRGVNDQPSSRSALRRFWRQYFAPIEPAFEEQPKMAPYDAVPLMGLHTEVERTKHVLQQERERLHEERERQAREGRRLADLEAELHRWEVQLRRRAAALPAPESD